MIDIRYAERSDWPFWSGLDRHIPEETYRRKVRDREAYVLLSDGTPAGVLRWNLFWDNTPFCTLLFIAPAFQRRGLGRMLMEHWEEDMRRRGHPLALTSTRTDEQAQHFYRRLGYRDCGGLLLDTAEGAQPMELILSKDLNSRG